MDGGIKLTHELDIPGDLSPRARYDLISSSLLRLKTSVNDLQLPNRNAEAARAAEQIRSRFDGNTEQYLKTLHDQKLTQEQFQKKNSGQAQTDGTALPGNRPGGGTVRRRPENLLQSNPGSTRFS